MTLDVNCVSFYVIDYCLDHYTEKSNIDKEYTYHKVEDHFSDFVPNGWRNISTKLDQGWQKSF